MKNAKSNTRHFMVVNIFLDIEMHGVCVLFSFTVFTSDLLFSLCGATCHEAGVFTCSVVAAFGCAPLVAPSGVWLRLGGGDVQTAVFRCNDSAEAWHLLCRGTRWVGHVGNCTAATPESSSSWRSKFLANSNGRIRHAQKFTG